MAGPYIITVPVGGQPAKASLFGVPVRNAILDLDARVSQSETEQQRILARARRTTTSQNFAVTGTDYPVLRVDGIPVVAGYMYRISTSGINLDTTVANDVVSAHIFADTTGVATVASPQLGQIRDTLVNTTHGSLIPLMVFFYAATDATLSVLLAGRRDAGTGTCNFPAGGSNPIDLTVEYAGVDPGDTGVIL